MIQLAGNLGEQSIQATARDRRQRQHVAPELLREALLHGAGGRQLAFGHDDNLGPLAEPHIVLLQLAADRLVVGQRIGAVGRLGLDQVDEDAGPLDVPQKLVPQADAGMGPFDQARECRP